MPLMDASFYTAASTLQSTTDIHFEHFINLRDIVFLNFFSGQYSIFIVFETNQFLKVLT